MTVEQKDDRLDIELEAGGDQKGKIDACTAPAAYYVRGRSQSLVVLVKFQACSSPSRNSNPEALPRNKSQGVKAV